VFVEDYLRRAVGQDRIASSDPNEVRRWLAREFGMSMTPLQAAGLEVQGAEICLLEGRRGAMIVYRIGGAMVSHYLVPRDGTRPSEPVVSRRASRSGVVTPPIVIWSTAAVEQALVGEVGSEELLRLARRYTND